MTTSVQMISWQGIAWSFVPVAVAVGILLRWSLGPGTALYALARMLVQLLAVGLVLTWIFEADRALPIMAVLVVMITAASWIAMRPLAKKDPRIYARSLTAIAVGGGLTLALVTQLSIGLEPWYDPRYLIPLSGMIFGNSMTGASLAAERLSEEIRSRRDEIETALCLGATARQACGEALKNALNAALIPTVNSMAAMGIVFLPGMMTGQILSGTEPMIAVKYQIAIMCVITGSVALTSFLILWQGYRSFFTPHDQLLIHDES